MGGLIAENPPADIPLRIESNQMSTTIALSLWGVGAFINLTAVIFFRKKGVPSRALFRLNAIKQFYTPPGRILYYAGSSCILAGFVFMYFLRY